MNYVKPQKPLIQDGKGIYPITTIDQVVRADGRRFSENEFNRVFQRNLLRPTLPTTTTNGVTCTNNGDGTYTLNGTASTETIFTLGSYSLSKGTYKLLALNISTAIAELYVDFRQDDGTQIIVNSPSGYVYNSNGQSGFLSRIIVGAGYTCNNLVVKPMITEDLNATYDDFVSYDDSLVTGSQVLPIFNNAGFKNSIFRGQYLGTSITTAQYNAIANGSFEDLYLGDYWNIGGHNWRIWGFNTFLNTGDTQCTSNHILLMPDDNYLKANGSDTRYMKDSNDTSGGYKATKFFQTYAGQIYNELTPYFGSHILSHRELISNATSNGKASGWEWASVTVGIPTEINIYGSSVWGASEIAGTGYNIGVNKTVFPLAVVEPSLITNREGWWLRDVVSASNFAYVTDYGRADYYAASSSWVGVRPYILIS